MDGEKIEQITNEGDNSIETEKSAKEPNPDISNVPGVEKQIETNKPSLDISDEFEKLKNSVKQAVKAIIPIKVEEAIKKEKIEEKIKILDDKIKDSNLKTIETLGIFVALFTFVSISFNIFNRVADLWSAGIFVLLIFSLLSLMILLLDFLLNNKPAVFFKDSRLILCGLVIIFTFGALYLLRDFPINPIPNSVEFETSLNNRLNESILKFLENNNKNFYSKSEIDKLLENILK